MGVKPLENAENTWVCVRMPSWKRKECAGSEGANARRCNAMAGGVVQEGCLTGGRRIPSNREMLRHAVKLTVIRHDAIWRRGDASGRFA